MNFFCYVVINAFAFFITFRVWVMVFFFSFSFCACLAESLSALGEVMN